MVASHLLRGSCPMDMDSPDSVAYASARTFGWYRVCETRTSTITATPAMM
jgi:hypothetical protein